MVGVIWTIQVVHYPGFSYVGDEIFKKFSEFHQRKITYVVMPPMLAEISTAVALFAFEDFASRTLLGINLLLVILIWVSTFLLSMPGHKVLTEGKDIAAIDKLVVTNWPRTILWSLRVLVLIALGVENFSRI